MTDRSALDLSADDSDLSLAVALVASFMAYVTEDDGEAGTVYAKLAKAEISREALVNVATMLAVQCEDGRDVLAGIGLLVAIEAGES